MGPFKEILKALAGEEGAGPAAANGHEGGAGLCPPASYSAEGSEGQLLGVIRELKLGSWALFLSIFIWTDEMGEPRKSRTEAVEERNRNLLNRKLHASR